VSCAAPEQTIRIEGIPVIFTGMSDWGTNFFGYFLFSQKKVTRHQGEKETVRLRRRKRKNEELSLH
jgi:hypothetical protein